MKQLLAIFLLIGTMTHAQSYEQDILRFSYNDYNGTSRFVGVGGAFSSVGADFSNLSHNPAGIGMYRSSIFVASPSLFIPKTTSSYLGTSRDKSQPQFVYGSVGAVFSTGDLKKENKGLINNAAIGLGLNRTADFSRKEIMEGFNENGSIVDTWQAEVISMNGSNDVSVNPEDGFSFEAHNAYWAYLVNYDSTVASYTTPIEDSVLQHRIMTTTGGKNEIVLSAGANYADKLYFGATIGVPYLNYDRTTIFTETDEEDANPDFEEFKSTQTYNTTGLGYNLKAGIIYKPNDYIRIGAAVQTPEKLSLTETYSSSIESRVFGFTESNQSPEGTFDYQVRLPWRANAGVSFFFKKYGFIAFDYEAVDYGSMKYLFADEYAAREEEINLNIDTSYTLAHNFRVGIEIIPVKKLRIRAGYSYQGSPFDEKLGLEDYGMVTQHFSGGFGIVHNRIAFDMAYRHSVSKEIEYPYAGVEAVKKEIVKPMVSMTIAYKLQ
ncbi:MAG: OmpP1/FadL family transporter [Chitinophagales bacterium]